MKLYSIYNAQHELLFKGNSLEVLKAGYFHSEAPLYKCAKRGTTSSDGYTVEAEEQPSEPLDPICCVCGRTFKGSLSAAYCPICRKSRKACHAQRTKAAKYIPSDELGEAMHECIKWCLKNNKPTYNYGTWATAGRPTVW